MKQWGIERYKGFLIDGSAVPTFATGFDWYSQGIIFRPTRLGSIVEIKRIKGPIFNSKEAAEEHGLELCRTWINEYEAMGKNRKRLDGLGHKRVGMTR